MNKNRFWIAIGTHPGFTKDDNSVFRVFPSGQKGAKSYELSGVFLEADSFEDIKSLLYKAVDDFIAHEIHMDDLDGQDMTRPTIDKKPQKEPIKDSDPIDSISIGEFVGGDKKSPSAGDGLLDLTDLL